MNRVLAVAEREWRRVMAMPVLWLLLLPIPLAMTLVLGGIFHGEVVRDLPVAVLDLDRSTTSRTATRWLESTRGGHVVAHVEDLGEARSEILDGKAYAVLVIPRHFERDLGQGRSPHVALLYSDQNITAGNNLSADVARGVSTAAGTIVASRGREPAPIRVDLHVLFNPGANYGWALLILFIAGLLQVVIGVSTVYAVGRELADRSAAEWLDAAGGSTLSAWVGKLLPYTVFHCVLTVLLVGIYVVWFRVPVHGSVPRLGLSILAFVVASQALALLLIAGTASQEKGLTLASFIFGPAAAFSGVTFPLQAMTGFGYAWAQFIPLTHAMKLARVGINVGDQAPIAAPLLALATITVVTMALSFRRLPRLLRDPALWGRE